jgi:hypothetical protein
VFPDSVRDDGSRVYGVGNCDESVDMLVVR